MPSVVYRRPDGRWHARPGGKHLGYFETEEAARDAVRASRAPLNVGTVRDWAACWQSLYPGRRNDQTAAHNATMVEPFVRHHGRLTFEQVTPLVAQAWAVNHPGHVRYLRLMFDKAERAGLVETNVWKRVECDRSLGAPRVPPSPEGLARLVTAARASGRDPFADLILFTAYSGLRLSEVAGVQATDVLESGRRVVVRGKRRAGESAPRVRVAAVFGPGREALRRQTPQVGLVFRSPAGRPLTKHSVGRVFREVRADAGFAGSFHALRHYAATWLLDRGASDRDVAVQLGHVDEAGHVDTTQVRRTYGHPSVSAALERLEAVAG